MSIHQSNGRHGIGNESPPEWIQAAGEKVGVSNGILKVETVGVELWDRRRGDDDPLGQLVFDDVQCEKKGLVEGGGEAIVGRGRE